MLPRSSTLSVILLASIVSAYYSNNAVPRRDRSSYKTVLYWGYNGTNGHFGKDLKTYCFNDSGVDILILSFLSSLNTTSNIFTGQIGDCIIDEFGGSSECDDISEAIRTCHDSDKKVLISIGGPGADLDNLDNVANYSAVAQNLWDSYGNPGEGKAPRPFEEAIIDGFDFYTDIQNSGLAFFAQSLRNTFTKEKQYLLTGAPQCFVYDKDFDDHVLGVPFRTVQFDHLFVREYAGSVADASAFSPACGNGTGKFDWAQWNTTLSKSASNASQIFIGLAAGGSTNIPGYRLDPVQLAKNVDEYESHAQFGGLMVWQAGDSDANVFGGCTYVQNAHNIFSEGQPCKQLSSSSTTSSPASASSTTPAGVAGGFSNGTVNQNQTTTETTPVPTSQTNSITVPLSLPPYPNSTTTSMTPIFYPTGTGVTFPGTTGIPLQYSAIANSPGTGASSSASTTDLEQSIINQGVQQCGGTDKNGDPYTGVTTCPTGYYCKRLKYDWSECQIMKDGSEVYPLR